MSSSYYWSEGKSLKNPEDLIFSRNFQMKDWKYYSKQHNTVMTARWVAGGGDCLNEESNLQLKHQNHPCLPAPEIVVIELKMIEEWWVLKTNVTVQVLVL